MDEWIVGWMDGTKDRFVSETNHKGIETLTPGLEQIVNVLNITTSAGAGRVSIQSRVCVFD